MKCGGSMRSQITGGKRYYTCHQHYIFPQACEGTYVSANTLSSVIIKELHVLYKSYIDEAEVESRIYFTTEFDSEIQSLKQQIKTVSNEIDKIKSRFKHLYFDKIDGLLSEDDFKLLSSECKEKQAELEATLQNAQNKYEAYIYNKEHKEWIKELISNYKEVKALDRYAVELLIDYIEVGGNKQKRTLRLHWNF